MIDRWWRVAVLIPEVGDVTELRVRACDRAGAISEARDILLRRMVTDLFNDDNYRTFDLVDQEPNWDYQYD